MKESESLFAVLRRSADGAVVAAIEKVVATGSDRELNRINPLRFAEKHALPAEATISAFLHAARLGLFEMAWNVLCPGCGACLAPTPA